MVGWLSWKSWSEKKVQLMFLNEMREKDERSNSLCWDGYAEEEEKNQN